MTKLILLFLVVSLTPIAVMGYISYSLSKITLKRQCLDSLTSIEKSRETAIFLYLKAKTGRLLDFSSDGVIRNYVEKINQKPPEATQLSGELSRYLFENKKPLDPECYETFIIDISGKVSGSSNKDAVGTDKSRDSCFTEGKKGIYVKSAYYSDNENSFFIAISAPLLSMTTKEFIGVIVNRYDLTGLNEITTDREGMGKSGEIYLVDRDGYMITESRFIKGSTLKLKVDTEPVRLLQIQGKSMTGIYPDYRGISVVGASGGHKVNKEFGLGWTILAEMDTTEAFVFVKGLAFRTLWTGLIAGALVSVIAYFASRRIANPIKKISNKIIKVGGGDLTVTVPYENRPDEIGTLARTLITMIKNHRDISREIIEGVNILSSSSSQILASTAQVASGASETATAVSQTTTTVEEVKQTSQVSVQKAKYVLENAQKTMQISQSGKKAIEESTEGMNRIMEQMASISESIVRLSEHGQAIGEIIATVDDLAEQTNLLSVNAAIEAAKAGEEGKGFAVVAQEIKNLAEQSKQSTTQIRTILNNIQKATNTAVMATEQGNKTVEAGVKQAAQAGEAIKILTDNIAEASQAAVQIVASSQQQMVGMDQVALAMENIKQASTQNAAGTKQAETAVQNMSDLGRKLKQMVEKYKV